MHVAAELEEILSIAVCDGCDSDVAHSGPLVKWFSGSIVVRSTYESIVTTNRCVRGSIVLVFLVAVRILFFFSRVAHVVGSACDQALVTNVYFFAAYRIPIPVNTALAGVPISFDTPAAEAPINKFTTKMRFQLKWVKKSNNPGW